MGRLTMRAETSRGWIKTMYNENVQKSYNNTKNSTCQKSDIADKVVMYPDYMIPRDLPFINPDLTAKVLVDVMDLW